jgi:hypothetical protein
MSVLTIEEGGGCIYVVCILQVSRYPVGLNLNKTCNGFETVVQVTVHVLESYKNKQCTFLFNCIFSYFYPKSQILL